MKNWTIVSFGVPGEIAEVLAAKRLRRTHVYAQPLQHVEPSVLKDLTFSSGRWQNELCAMLDFLPTWVVQAEHLIVVLPPGVDPRVDRVIADYLGPRKGSKRGRQNFQVVRPSDEDIHQAGLIVKDRLQQHNRPQLARVG